MPQYLIQNSRKDYLKIMKIMKGGAENYDLLIKIQSEIMKMTSNIKLFIFCMIYNFSKCDGFTAL